MRPPEWLPRLWPQILRAGQAISGWAEGYSHGYIREAERDFPTDLPQDIPEYKSSPENDWADFPHKKLFFRTRQIGDTGSGPMGRDYPEFMFGTYAVFRVTRDEYRLLNEGYEDTAGTENERFIEDGDHVVVVYML